MATIRQRLSAAIDVYRRGYPLSVRYDGTRPDSVKASPIVWPEFRLGNPSWEMVDSQAYVEEGFNANALIYAAVMAKARAQASAPLRAYRGDPDNPELLDSDAPLARICTQPNPSMSWREFQQLMTIYLNITGNAYAYVDRDGSEDGVPSALWILNPLRVRIVPERGAKIGYVYIPEGVSPRDGIPILLQDMIHVKLPNPGDPLDGEGYGLSPISACARSADVDNIITKFIQLFFEHGALTAGVLKFNQPLDDKVVARIKERWQEMYGGYEQWTNVGVLDQSGEYQRISLTFAEMGFETLDERNAARILMVFGVQPIIVSDRLGLKYGTYSNYEQARKAFWQDTIIPEMELFQAAYSYYLQSDSGDFVRFDYSSVPALQIDLATTAPIYAAAYTTGAATVNEYRKAIGLDAIEGGEMRVMPMNLMPIGAEYADTSAQTQQPDKPEAESDARAKALNDLLVELKEARIAAIGANGYDNE